MVRRPTSAWLALVLMTFLLPALFTVVQSRNKDYSFMNPKFVGPAKALGTDTRTSFTLPHPGDLDQTFGDSGKVTANFFGSSAFAYAAVLQPDGKIIAAGGNSTSKNFSLARFLTNGSLDYSFGSEGKVTTGFKVSNDFAFAQAVALQPDGKIVAGGLANNSTGAGEFAIVRYMPDGSLDSSFGSSGKVTTSVSGFDDRVRAILIQPDGRILAVGSASRAFAGLLVTDFALVRYNSDGTLDNSFGSLGKVTTEFFGDDDYAQAVVIQADAKIVVAGWITDFDSRAGRTTRFALVRYNSDGTLDHSFGSLGTVITLFNSEFEDDQAFAVALQPDSKILVAGWATGTHGGADFALARYNTDGTLDQTFGSSGKVTTDFSNLGNDKVTSMTLQPDGKIVAAGVTDLRTSQDSFALARYNPDGSLDNSFGLAGKVTTTFFFDLFDSSVSAVALQPDGKIVAVGWAFFSPGNHFALARYIGDPVASPTPTPTPTATPTPTPTPTPLELLLDDSGPTMNQVAALDSILFLRDPFRVFNGINVLKLAIDPNTRVVVFVRNLQLLQGESASSVVVRLVDSVQQNREVPAEDVRPVLNFDFAQVTFRLPDNLPVDDYAISVKAHAQVSNSGVIRIR
jgi:uncharacterized delta-60 repeat protein